jgi:hypothetical protein
MGGAQNLHEPDGGPGGEPDWSDYGAPQPSLILTRHLNVRES